MTDVKFKLSYHDAVERSENTGRILMVEALAFDLEPNPFPDSKSAAMYYVFSELLLGIISVNVMLKQRAVNLSQIERVISQFADDFRRRMFEDQFIRSRLTIHDFEKIFDLNNGDFGLPFPIRLICGYSEERLMPMRRPGYEVTSDRLKW